MLATYGFVHFSGMSKLLEGGSDLSLTPIILDAFFLDASFAVSLWTLLKPWGLQMAKTAGIAQKFEPGLPIQKERHTEDPRLVLLGNIFVMHHKVHRRTQNMLWLL